MLNNFEADYYAEGLAHWLGQEVDHTAVPMDKYIRHLWLYQGTWLYDTVLVTAKFYNPNLKAKLRRPRPIIGWIDWDKEQQRWYIQSREDGRYLAGFWGGNVKAIIVNPRQRQVVIHTSCAQLLSP